MADISKCTGVDCPIKKECYRYTATSSILQSWAYFKYDKIKKECKDFYNNK